MNATATANPWRLVQWTDGHGRPVKNLICHDDELGRVLNLPFPPGAVARDPVTEFTGVNPSGPRPRYFRRMPWVAVGARFAENINQGDRDCEVVAVDEATGAYLYAYQMPGGREFMRRGPEGHPVTRSRLSLKWKRLLGDVE